MTSEVIVRRRHGGTDFSRTIRELEEIMTDVQTATATTKTRFSPEFFAAFWAAPSMSHSMDMLADDIIGYWPGDNQPVRGFKAYTQKIADLLAVAPDLTLELVDSATAAGPAEGEELFFLHYVGRATGPHGPVEIRGLDRVRTRDGVVVENVIRYDPVFV
jgi:SnoaL-like domain